MTIKLKTPHKIPTTFKRINKKTLPFLKKLLQNFHEVPKNFVKKIDIKLLFKKI